MNRTIIAKYIITTFFLFLLLLSVLGCGDGTSTVRQMQSTYSQEETELKEANTWTVLPRAALVVQTTQESTIQALFIAEGVGKIVTVSEGEISEFPIGVPIEVRIEIDGEDMFPSSTQLVGHGLTFASHSFFAFRDQVAPGAHSIVVKWRSTHEGAKIRNRTLTVWETD